MRGTPLSVTLATGTLHNVSPVSPEQQGGLPVHRQLCRRLPDMLISGRQSKSGVAGRKLAGREEERTHAALAICSLV